VCKASSSVRHDHIVTYMITSSLESYYIMLLTYEPTPWFWILVLQLVKNFRIFYGKQKFIAVFTRAFHWSLSWARWIQSIPTLENYFQPHQSQNIKALWVIGPCNSVKSTDISEECHWTCTKLHGEIFCIVTAVRTSNHNGERDYLEECC
jgi:hypothetical protein